jgi:single-strand DNA-binding protein
VNNLNFVIIEGRLTKDPDMRYTQGGTAVTSFSLACNRARKVDNERKDTVCYVNCVAWQGLAEAAVKLKKGDLCIVEGFLNQRSWEKDGEKKTVLEIVVDKLFNRAPREKDGVKPDAKPQGKPEVNPFADNDIPF